jgi:hypothetical protein
MMPMTALRERGAQRSMTAISSALPMHAVATAIGTPISTPATMPGRMPYTRA